MTGFNRSGLETVYSDVPRRCWYDSLSNSSVQSHCQRCAILRSRGWFSPLLKVNRTLNCHQHLHPGLFRTSKPWWTAVLGIWIQVYCCQTHAARYRFISVWIVVSIYLANRRVIERNVVYGWSISLAYFHILRSIQSNVERCIVFFWVLVFTNAPFNVRYTAIFEYKCL